MKMYFFVDYILKTTRHVLMITITLSKKELNTSSIGYQEPLPAYQVKVSNEFEYEGAGSPTARGRCRGGGGRGRERSRAAPGIVEKWGKQNDGVDEIHQKVKDLQLQEKSEDDNLKEPPSRSREKNIR